MAFARGGNKEYICRATTIPRYSFREVLNLVDAESNRILLHVPIFQRRYCWGASQLENFVKDIIKFATKPYERVGKKSHSFGRIVVSERDEDNRLVIVDGQQRLTTVCIFLSSVRDFLVVRGMSAEIVRMINKILFPLGNDKDCILTPTYFDREPFRACVKTTNSFTEYISQSESGGNARSDIINSRLLLDQAVCSGYLFKRIASKFIDCKFDVDNTALVERTILSTLQVVLDGFNVLFFKMIDKTNTMNSYFRLAIREFGMKNMFSVDSPGVSMATADLIRNVLLTCFNGEEQQLRMYQTYWAPVEKIARMAGLEQEKDKNVNMVKNMTLVLNKFIEGEDPEIIKKGEEARSKLKWQDPSILLFPLYTKLLTCIEGELATNGVEVPVVLSKVTPKIENIVMKWLQKFKVFVEHTFDGKGWTGLQAKEISSMKTGGIFHGSRKGTYLSKIENVPV